MKVLNYTTSYLAVILLVLISIWAGIFYYAMLDEIYDSIDDGLDNQKGLILQKVAVDSTVLNKRHFEEGDYTIREVTGAQALHFREQYADTLMYMQNEKEYEPVRLLKTVFRHQGRYYQMQVMTSMVEEDDLVIELLYALIWLYAGLLISILLVNNILLKKIWQPFYNLLKQIKHFKLEKGANIQTEPTKIDEFRLLQQTVRQLLQNNIDAYTGQKHFIENASHELQTPLAISINKLEALAESPTLTKKDLTLLAAAMQNLQRLTRLNKSLLLLFKIENKQYAEVAQVDMGALVKKITFDFEDQLAYYDIDLRLQIEEPITVQMNPDLAAMLVTNLVKNAVVHNYKGGFIHLIVSPSQLLIENSGIDKALDEQTLFTRFYSENGGENSNGLGLAIVKAIADLYGFGVQYTYQQKHSIYISF